jgi:hypothetical protein
MRKLIAVLMVCVSAVNSFGGSYFKDGNSLFKSAREWDKYYQGQQQGIAGSEIGYFQGYVAGVMDEAGDNLKTPPHVTLDQACAVVSKYLKDKPEELHRPAAELVKEAITSAYSSH